MDAVLIENPTASAVTRSRLHVVERALAATFDLEVVSTAARGHAAELAREAVRAGAKTVIAYGGDGTANEVINGLAGVDVSFAPLPGGGTNVLARTLGYPNELVEATGHLIDLVERGSRRRIGLGHLTASGPDLDVDRLFAFGAGIVLDGDAVRRVDASGLRPRLGDLAFIWCTTRAFFALRRTDGPPLRIRTPDGDVEAWWATIANSQPFTYLGRRPFRVHPEASADRGLDLVAGRSVRVVRTVRWVTQALRSGRHVRHKDILHLPDQASIVVEATVPVPLQTDGEFLGEVTRLEARSVSETLSVWA